MKISTQRKAVMSGAIAGLGTLVTALVDNAVTLAEAAVVLFAVASAYGAVYGIRNGEKVSSG